MEAALGDGAKIKRPSEIMRAINRGGQKQAGFKKKKKKSILLT